MSEDKRYIPVMASNWKVLFKPRKTGCYVNDHSIVRADDGSWHLFGITSPTPEINPQHERYFVHGWGSSLEEGLTNESIAIDYGTRAWAPGVIQEGKKYYMYYGPAPTKLEVSPDLHHWMNNDVHLIGSPIDACHRDHMVLRLNDYTWIMYATGIRGTYGCISAYVSNDLQNWRFVQYALTTSGNAPLNPAWGATESPYVVCLDGYYYLFITYTDCSDESYNQTFVFRSSNPYDFGDYNGDNEEEVVVAKLFGHASEVIRDPDSGNWYITACGWPGKSIPHENAVSIARLEWRNE
jgi:beta-fructofuranosidase